MLPDKDSGAARCPEYAGCEQVASLVVVAVFVVSVIDTAAVDVAVEGEVEPAVVDADDGRVDVEASEVDPCVEGATLGATVESEHSLQVSLGEVASVVELAAVLAIPVVDDETAGLLATVSAETRLSDGVV